MKRSLTLGSEVKPGMVVPCPRCGTPKRHRILKPDTPEQMLQFIKCHGSLIAVAIENRYLPSAN